MTREIKFRAWDKQLNKWWYSNDIEAEFLGEILQGKYPEMVIQQYTGLKDKNGKEIYEGDILRITGNQGEHIRTVSAEMNWDWDGGGVYGWCLGSEDPNTESEVIGNVYQNPELLTTKGEE